MSEVPEIISAETIAAWSEDSYRIEKYGKDPSVVLIGEEHHRPDLISKQLELIEMLDPEFVLHEFGSGWIHDPAKETTERQPGRKWDAVENPEESQVPREFIDHSNRMGYTIVGCDLTATEFALAELDIARLNPKYEIVSLHERDLGHLDIPGDIYCKKLFQLIDPYREAKMIETIHEYRAKTTRPLVVVMGQIHASRIHRKGLMKGKDFGYVMVDQIGRRKPEKVDAVRNATRKKATVIG